MGVWGEGEKGTSKYGAKWKNRGGEEGAATFEGTENERGDADAEQTLNDFHCFEKLSYQRESPQPLVLPPLSFLPRRGPSPRHPPPRPPNSPTRRFPSSNHLRHLPPSRSPSYTGSGCAVYKPCPTRNGTFFKLFPGKIRYQLLSLVRVGFLAIKGNTCRARNPRTSIQRMKLKFAPTIKQ